MIELVGIIFPADRIHLQIKKCDCEVSIAGPCVFNEALSVLVGIVIIHNTLHCEMM